MDAVLKLQIPQNVGNSWLAEDLLACPEVLYSIQLVSVLNIPKRTSVHYILLEFMHRHVRVGSPSNVFLYSNYYFMQYIRSPDIEMIQLRLRGVFCSLLNEFCQTASLRLTWSFNRTENGPWPRFSQLTAIVSSAVHCLNHVVSFCELAVLLSSGSSFLCIASSQVHSHQMLNTLKIKL